MTPGAANTSDVIRLEDVAKSYGATKIIEGLNLNVVRGEFLTLLGPSGCGKTTTLRMIAGFELPTAGRVLLDGEDVSDLPPYKRPLNTVFQNYALFPHMSVWDNVAFGPRTTGLPAAEVTKRVDEALSMVSMSAHGPKRPGLLSGGQQQRVALARALVNQPTALLLDEPLSALDVKLRRGLQIELKRIQSAIGTTFVFVTHDQEEALTMSSRIAVMNGGRIEQLDPPEVVYNRPATPFVAGFIGHANLLPATVDHASGGQAQLTLPGGGGAQAQCCADQAAHAQAATLMLRPEHLSILAGQNGAGMGFAAQVAGIDFQGAAFRYELRRPDDSRVIAYIPAQNRPDGVQPGDPVWATWLPDQAWVIPDNTSPTGVKN